MIQLGQDNLMKVHEQVDFGFYLIHSEHDDEVLDEDKVLLPNAYVPEGLSVGDEIEVFIYLDSEDRIIATNLEPKIKCDQFALLKVTQVNQVGAFADIGLAKDLLIPFRQQAKTMEEGKHYLVRMYLDDTTQRLIGSSKVNQFLNNNFIKLLEGEQVDLIVVNKSSLGYNVIVEGKHKGLIFHSDVFQKLNVGQELKGFVKQIREDGKLDITLQQQGLSAIEPNAQAILSYLKQEGGKMNITDKSDPDLIYGTFEMSKKAFKKAIGSLYKKRLISLHPDHISIID